MRRFALLLVCLLVGGCGDPSATAPMLILKIERGDGAAHSIGRHRVFHTGVLSESGDFDGKGNGVRQKIAVQTIADDGVTLTFETSDASGNMQSSEVFVPYGQQVKQELPNGSTLIAELEARE